MQSRISDSWARVPETGDTRGRAYFHWEGDYNALFWYIYISAQDIETRCQRAREEVAERGSVQERTNRVKRRRAHPECVSGVPPIGHRGVQMKSSKRWTKSRSPNQAAEMKGVIPSEPRISESAVALGTSDSDILGFDGFISAAWSALF